MLRSLKDTLKVIQVLDPDSVTATGNSDGVDTKDCGSVSFAVAVGATSGNAFDASHNIDIVVQDSEVDTDGSYADCVDADIFDAEDGANGIAKILDATDDADAVHMVHYRGSKRYVRVRLEETGTVDVPIAILAIKGHNELLPPL